MKAFLKPGVLFSVILIVAVSCKKEKSQGVNFEYNYFPNTVGKYVIYDVDSIYCSSFDYKIDTIRYQLKEIIQSIFLDNSGRPTQRIARYIKPYNDSAAWTLRNVWTANLATTDAERVENNVRYVKLIFPVVLNSSWNGNAFNTLGSANYNYTTVDQPKAIGTSYFDSVLTVSQINSATLISDSLYVEQYAKNVGLVYKEVIAVNDTSSSIQNLSIPILQRPYQTGILKYTLTVNSHN
jgi:hypothetical protein